MCLALAPMKRLLGECQSGNYIEEMSKKSAKSRERIAVLGYGSQGRAVALNFRDSGYNILVGLPAGSKSRNRAKLDKFRIIVSVTEATKKADIICFAFPDY